MKLAAQDRLELTHDEHELLALACAGEPLPALTVEGFADWLIAPLSEHELALRHGARIVLKRCYCDAFAWAHTDSAGGTLWAITRHPGALAWLHSHGVRPNRAVEHMELHQLGAGDTVVGILPLSLVADLSARGVRCLHLTIDLQSCDRGRELGPARMRECGARLEAFEVIRSLVPCLAE